jgi:hypothetical protein
MNLPIRFPSNVEVVTEQVARFRALSDEAQVRTLDELFRAYQFLAARAAKPEALAHLASEDEANNRAAIEEFVSRHG